MAETDPAKQRATRYFVAKCGSMDSLRRCVATNTWASRERVQPPQPHDILTEAFNQGPVMLLFSVNNCHGWHGYCHMTSIPNSSCKSAESSLQPERDSNTEGNISVLNESKFVNDDTFSSSRLEQKSNHVDVPESGESKEQTNENVNAYAESFETSSSQLVSQNEDKTEQSKESWHYFSVKWNTEFISKFGETCLPSTKTTDLPLCDSVSPLNKARNWQEMPADVGTRVRYLLDELHADLVERRRKAEEEALAAKPPPFIQMEEGGGGESVADGAGKYWKQIVEKVERELGTVHLACPFGSQRYNLQQPDSDIDAFIVYQARTKDLLGFDAPKMTVKNSDKETCDYTLLEVKRYCELLLSYDARCIETLFLHDDTIVQASQEWRQLHTFRQQFLTRKCLDKYTGDALGSNGVQKLLRLLEGAALSHDESPSPRIAKLAYIVVRLLQNAANVAMGEALQVFRHEGSVERDVLLRIRKRDVTVGEIKAEIQRLQDEIEQHKDGMTLEIPSTRKELESWLLSLRFQDFQSFPRTETTDHT